VARLIAEGAKEAGIAAEKIHEVLTEPEAVSFALGLAKPGDLVVIFADDVTQTWKQVIYWGKPAADHRAVEVESA
jgi:cyanophycin synthetase